jgi:4-hydroxybenzoate polyprenyltransferase
MHVLLLDLPIAIYLLHLGIVSTMYNVPRKSNGIVKFPLRSIPFLKILLIAYVWASLFAILPIIISSNDQKLSDTLFMFAAHFLFIVSITLPFDIRDFKTDHENLLTTIPHVVGIKLAKALSLLCLTIFYIMMLPSLEPIYLTVLYLITAGLIIFSSSRRKNYYFTLFIDGTIILYYIAIQLSG